MLKPKAPADSGNSSVDFPNNVDTHMETAKFCTKTVKAALESAMIGSKGTKAATTSSPRKYKPSI